MGDGPSSRLRSVRVTDRGQVQLLQEQLRRERGRGLQRLYRPRELAQRQQDWRLFQHELYPSLFKVVCIGIRTRPALDCCRSPQSVEISTGEPRRKALARRSVNQEAERREEAAS